MPIQGDDYNASNIFRPYKDEESTLEKQDIERDYTNLVRENSNTGSRAKNGLSERIPQNGLLASESLSFFREVRFSEQKFPVGKPISDIKYYYLSSQNHNPFKLFND